MGEAPADERRSTETSSDSPTKPRDTEARFATTRWSLVASVRDEDPLRARAALSELCENYWPPIYAYLRRRGHSTHEAQDLTQSFVVELLERDLLGRADADRGKFRSFLLGACQHFLSHERERAAAKKRGGHRQTLRLDFARGEELVARASNPGRSPEAIFEREWALTLLENVLDRLRDDYASRGKAEPFRQLEPFITAGDPTIPYTELAARLGLSENAAKVTVHRLRRRYRELLRSEVAGTLTDESAVDAELEQLIAALG